MFRIRFCKFEILSSEISSVNLYVERVAFEVVLSNSFVSEERPFNIRCPPRIESRRSRNEGNYQTLLLQLKFVVGIH